MPRMPKLPRLPPVLDLTAEAGMLICVSQARNAAILMEIIDRLADIAEGKPPTRDEIMDLRVAISEMSVGNEQLLKALIEDQMLSDLPVN